MRPHEPHVKNNMKQQITIKDVQGGHYYMHPADIQDYCLVGKVADAYLIHLHTTDERVIKMYLDDANKNIVISNFKKVRPQGEKLIDTYVEGTAGTWQSLAKL